MKKKLLCGILAMALACSLYGCGSSGAATTVPPNTTEAAGGDTAAGAVASDLPEMTFSIGHSGTEDSWNQSKMCIRDSLHGGHQRGVCLPDCGKPVLYSGWSDNCLLYTSRCV